MGIRKTAVATLTETSFAEGLQYSGDLALAVAVREVKRLDACPTAEALEAVGEPWRPWRAVAARRLWHYYLSRTASNKSSEGTGRKAK